MLYDEKTTGVLHRQIHSSASGLDIGAVDSTGVGCFKFEVLNVLVAFSLEIVERIRYRQ